MSSSITVLKDVRDRKFGLAIAPAANSRYADNKPIKILLIEDNFADSILIQKELSHAFRDGAYHVQAARTQAQALGMLEENYFDVVLLDLTLPDATGLETLTQLQIHFPQIPVVVLTGHEDEDFALEAVGNGAQDYLIKSKVGGNTIKRVVQYSVQRKRLELDLHRARQDAEKANRAKSEFLASMSHELRTPLNAISGFAQMIQLHKGMTPPEREASYIEAILTSSDHLLSLINDVLDLAKIEAKQIPLQTTAVPLNKLLTEVGQLLAPLVHKKNIELQVTLEEDLTIQADYVRLLQVVLNLCSNAVKYNHFGGKVSIRVAQQQNMARITVTDTGFGIPAARQHELFQPFNRLGAETGPVQGTGIGLVISHQLITEMGGTVGFESTEGVGSSFWIELPQQK